MSKNVKNETLSVASALELIRAQALQESMMSISKDLQEVSAAIGATLKFISELDAKTGRNVTESMLKQAMLTIKPDATEKELGDALTGGSTNE